MDEIEEALRNCEKYAEQHITQAQDDAVVLAQAYRETKAKLDAAERVVEAIRGYPDCLGCQAYPATGKHATVCSVGSTLRAYDKARGEGE